MLKRVMPDHLRMMRMSARNCDCSIRFRAIDPSSWQCRWQWKLSMRAWKVCACERARVHTLTTAGGIISVFSVVLSGPGVCLDCNPQTVVA